MSAETIAAWPARHWKRTLFYALVLSVASLILILKLHADQSVQNMLPRGNPSAQAMGKVLSDFSAADQLLVLATLPAGGSQKDLLDFAKRLEIAVDNQSADRDLVEAVVYQADEKSKQFFEFKVAPAAIYYLSQERYLQARQRLTHDEIAMQIAQDETLLSTPGPAAQGIASATLLDPLRLHEFLLAEINARKPAGFALGGQGAFFSPDGRSLLIRIVGKQSLDNLDYAGHLTDAITRLSNESNAGRLTIDISGGYAIATASQRAIRHDMIISVVSSVILLQVLFILAYRRPIRYFLLAFLPVALGLLYGFGLRALLSHAISPAAAVVGAVLAGMGIDYTVLYLPHYHVARQSGSSPIKAAGRTTRQLFSPLTAACITSVIGFLAIGWSSVPALRDFALVGSLGLIGAMFCAVMILPALLVAQDRGEGQRGRPRLSLEPLLNFVARNRRRIYWVWMIVLSAALLIIILIPGPFLPMDSDLTVMHPRPNKALDAETTIARRMGTDPGAMAVYLNAKSESELIELAYDVQQRLTASSVRGAGVVGVFGLSTLLPDPRVVAARQAEMSTTRAHQITEDFHTVLQNSNLDEKAFSGYETFLNLLLSSPPAPTVEDLEADPRVAETILSRDEITGRSHSANEAMTLIFFDHPLDTRQQRQTAVLAIRNALDGLNGAQLTGLGVVGLDTETSIQKDLPKLLVAAIGFNVLYLLLHLRSISKSMLSMIPAGVSLLLLAAFARLTGQKLNLVNLVALPLLIGIAVDYGIYLVSLARPAKPIPPEESRQRVATSGYSVMISATANIVGFGSLMTTSVPAIASLGWAVGVGVAGCFAGTLFLLAPMLMRDDIKHH